MLSFKTSLLTIYAALSVANKGENIGENGEKSVDCYPRIDPFLDSISDNGLYNTQVYVKPDASQILPQDSPMKPIPTISPYDYDKLPQITNHRLWNVLGFNFSYPYARTACQNVSLYEELQTQAIIKARLPEYVIDYNGCMLERRYLDASKWISGMALNQEGLKYDIFDSTINHGGSCHNQNITDLVRWRSTYPHHFLSGNIMQNCNPRLNIPDSINNGQTHYCNDQDMVQALLIKETGFVLLDGECVPVKEGDILTMNSTTILHHRGAAIEFNPSNNINYSKSVINESMCKSALNNIMLSKDGLGIA
jgi:hypothetical protein